LILGGFADRRLADLDKTGLDAFEGLLDAPDQEVYEWVTEQAPAPRDYDTPVLASIRAFRFELSTKPD
jgi:antitoxin CptB